MSARKIHKQILLTFVFLLQLISVISKADLASDPAIEKKDKVVQRITIHVERGKREDDYLLEGDPTAGARFIFTEADGKTGSQGISRESFQAALSKFQTLPIDKNAGKSCHHFRIDIGWQGTLAQGKKAKASCITNRPNAVQTEYTRYLEFLKKLP